MTTLNPAPSHTLRLMTISRFSELLANLQQETPGVLSATLASADGLTVASTLEQSQEADRISAMSGSISALAGALTRETGHGAPERLVLESVSGRIVSINVPTLSGDMVLTVVTNSASLLGKLLWNCKATVDALCICASETPDSTASPPSP